MNENVYELLLAQQKQIRELKLHVEALKRMFFEHRPPFIEAFAHQVGAVESSGYLRETDEGIEQLLRCIRDAGRQS
jgi:hypothetical protein